MVTFNQLYKKKRTKKLKIEKVPALNKNPQKKGICLKLIVRQPKKPNSALRKLVKLKLSNHLVTYAYIPGQGHNLLEFATVLIKGGKTKDLPGVKYKLIRGKYDLLGVKLRKTSRSKYGAKKN